MVVAADFKVSVIIPSYNSASSLADAIISVQAQTLERIEIIIVDDASTDATHDLLRHLMAEDERIVYRQLERNTGPAGCRNIGIGLARGEWIATLDSDDTFHPQRLQMLLDAGRRARADLVSDEIWVLEQAQPSARRVNLDVRGRAVRYLSLNSFCEALYSDVENNRHIGKTAIYPIVRKSFLEKTSLLFDPALRNGENLVFHFECLLAGARWLFEPDAMYIRTERQGSIGRTATSQSMERIFRTILDVGRSDFAQADPCLRKSVARLRRLLAPQLCERLLRQAVCDGNYAGIPRILCSEAASWPALARMCLALMKRRTVAFDQPV